MKSQILRTDGLDSYCLNTAIITNADYLKIYIILLKIRFKKNLNLNQYIFLTNLDIPPKQNKLEELIEFIKSH